jgi:hypothetical protein
MARNSSKKWTPEDDVMLRTLLEAGTRPLLVAAKLKRSLPAAKGRAYLLGISFKRIKVGQEAKRK